MPDTVLDVEGTAENKTDKNPCLELIFWVGGHKQIYIYIYITMSGEE